MVWLAFQMFCSIPTSSTLYGLFQGNNRNVWVCLWLEILVSEIGKAGFLSSGSHISPLHQVGEDQVKCIFFSALGWDSTQMDWSVDQGLCVPVPLAQGWHVAGLPWGMKMVREFGIKDVCGRMVAGLLSLFIPIPMYSKRVFWTSCKSSWRKRCLTRQAFTTQIHQAPLLFLRKPR